VTRNPTAFDRAWDLLAKRHQPGKAGCGVVGSTAGLSQTFLSSLCQRAPGFSWPEGQTRSCASLCSALYLARMAKCARNTAGAGLILPEIVELAIPDILHLERKGNVLCMSAHVLPANLSTPEAGRIIRALLVPENAGTRWTQHSLENHCRSCTKPIPVSIGLINKVVRRLRDEAFLQEEPKGDLGFVSL